jgi:protein kinase-like protein/PEGA domain-containing protein
VLHQIGAGTLGPVFRAYDAQRERLVAVKLFRLDLPPEGVHRLTIEFDRLIAAELSHPVIASPVAAGIAGASLYLAEDYVAGEALDLAIREYGAAPPADALRVATQIAGALDFAEAADISHGMLHPRDVLLSADETRITGIGIARALERVGITPPVRRPYAAPERMAGGAWDRRADVFSLAALIYELLWARRIAGPGAHAMDAMTDIAGARHAPLQAAFGRALAEDPDDRFDTALEFIDALNAAFPDAPLAKPASAPRSRPAARREEEPRLPLGEPAVPAAIAVDRAAHELEIRPPPPERFGHVDELAPEPALAAHESMPVTAAPLHAADDRVLFASTTHEPPPVDPAASRPARSSIWPLMAALIVGLALGFAGGYGTGSQDRAASPASPATASGRESTEVAVEDAAKPPVAAAKPPVAAVKPPVAAAKPPAAAVATPSAPRPAPPPSASSPLPAAPSPARAEPQALGRLLVRSTPGAAVVTVDGRDVGTTPVVVRNLAAGVHRVRVARDGYLPDDRRVTIAPSRPAQSIIVALERPRTSPVSGVAAVSGVGSSGRYAGGLSVDSRPSGANVYLDGRLVGVTPLSLSSIAAGEHAVRLERDGYQRWSSSVRIVAAEQNRVTASLEK